MFISFHPSPHLLKHLPFNSHWRLSSSNSDSPPSILNPNWFDASVFLQKCLRRLYKKRCNNIFLIFLQRDKCLTIQYLYLSLYCPPPPCFPLTTSPPSYQALSFPSPYLSPRLIFPHTLSSPIPYLSSKLIFPLKFYPPNCSFPLAVCFHNA